MKINVAYDSHGRIVAAGEAGDKHANDRPQEVPGLHVAELEVPTEHHGKKLHEFLHELQVDPKTHRLIAKG